ncbi:putative quinol monooxygenase [Streptomyces sp. L7]
MLWEAQAKAGQEAAMKAFMTAAVTASRHDAGNIDYEAHQVEGEPGTIRRLRALGEPRGPRRPSAGTPHAGSGCPQLCWN